MQEIHNIAAKSPNPEKAEWTSEVDARCVGSRVDNASRNGRVQRRGLSDENINSLVPLWRCKETDSSYLEGRYQARGFRPCSRTFGLLRM
jgi:hypothetical protein